MKKRSDGRIQRQVTIEENGVKVRKVFYGYSQREILDKINAYKGRKEDGVPLGEIATAWWQETEKTIADNSKRNYKPAYLRFYKAFCNKSVKEVRPIDISRFITKFAADHAEKTVKNQLSICNQILQYALNNGYTDINVARDVTIPKGLKKMKRNGATRQEIEIIKAHATDGLMERFAAACLYTGCRKGELLALTYDDVDTVSKTICISKTLYRTSAGRMAVKPPKTENGNRVLPLLPQLESIIGSGSGLVFPNENGTYITEGSFQKRWARLQKDLGINCTPHELRHSYATVLCTNGVDLQTAKTLMGHASISMTADIYADIKREQQIAAGNALKDLQW